MSAADRPPVGLFTDFGLAVDVRGGVDRQPLLFLHGGPGQGAGLFMAEQGDRLANRLRVFGLYQRGIPPSARLGEGGSLMISDLLADCERLRGAFGIDRWAVLGHSFGGALALRYAVHAPEHVSAVIFENPVWSTSLSAGAALPKVANLLKPANPEAAQRAVAASRGADKEANVWAEYRTAIEVLGDRRLNFFTTNARTRALLAASEDPDPQRDAEATRHHVAVMQDPTVHDSLLPLLPRLSCPSLLIVGEDDPLTSEEQRQAFAEAVAVSRISKINGAGHFVHVDRPDQYAELVTDFLTSPPR